MSLVTEQHSHTSLLTGTAPRGPWLTFVCWIERHKQRRDLAALDNHLLADIGLTREMADHECAKPFWRG